MSNLQEILIQSEGFIIELLSLDPEGGMLIVHRGGNDAGTTLLCLQGTRDEELDFQSNYAAITVNWGTHRRLQINTDT